MNVLLVVVDALRADPFRPEPRQPPGLPQLLRHPQAGALVRPGLLLGGGHRPLDGRRPHRTGQPAWRARSHAARGPHRGGVPHPRRDPVRGAARGQRAAAHPRAGQPRHRRHRPRSARGASRGQLGARDRSRPRLPRRLAAARPTGPIFLWLHYLDVHEHFQLSYLQPGAAWRPTAASRPRPTPSATAPWSRWWIARWGGSWPGSGTRGLAGQHDRRADERSRREPARGPAPARQPRPLPLQRPGARAARRSSCPGCRRPR